METDVYQMSVLSDLSSLNQTMNDLLSQLADVNQMTDFLCVVILLWMCLSFVFFNRRV